MNKKILVVLTNTAKYPNIKRATGLWLGEAVHFVDPVQQAGFTVDYVSPAGGYVPIDRTACKWPRTWTGSGTTTRPS